MDYSQIASEKSLNAAADALRKNGLEVSIVPTGVVAKEQVFNLIPAGAQVMTMSSETLRLTGIAAEINDSGRYDSVRARFARMDRVKDHREMQRLGAAPEWSIGSVHAVTEDGFLLIASNSGSQLPAHAYGADHVIFVVGAQKIVKDLAAGMERLEKYVLPLEDARAREVYGQPSSISQVLTMYKQRPGRVTMIIVREPIGF